jgi:hypothetical protein
MESQTNDGITHYSGSKYWLYLRNNGFFNVFHGEISKFSLTFGKGAFMTWEDVGLP